MPLLTRALAELFGVADADALNFAFLYGMLPAAPTVVIFAREFGPPRRSPLPPTHTYTPPPTAAAGPAPSYPAPPRCRPSGHPPDALAAIQLLGLVVSVPLLLVSTVAVELPAASAASAASLHSCALLRHVALGAAAASAAASAFAVARLAHGGRRLASLGAGTARWLGLMASTCCCLAAAVLAEQIWGSCATPSSSSSAAAAPPVATGELLLNGLVDWCLFFLRGQAAALAVLMAQQSCPDRSSRSTAA